MFRLDKRTAMPASIPRDPTKDAEKQNKLKISTVAGKNELKITCVIKLS